VGSSPDRETLMCHPENPLTHVTFECRRATEAHSIDGAPWRASPHAALASNVLSDAYWFSRPANNGPGVAAIVGSCGSCANRFIPQISARRTKKYANMTGQSTSSVISRPRLKVSPAPTTNNPKRRSDFLCSHQRMSRPAQNAISTPAATGPRI